MGVNGMYGLSGSGLDVDDIVKKMMTAKKQPYNKIFQTKTRAEWRKTEYNNLYTSSSDYRNEIFDFKLKSNLAPKKVTVSAAAEADKQAVSVTANADAVTFTHNVEVLSVAQSASMGSESKVEFKKKVTAADGTTSTIEPDTEMKLSSLLYDQARIDSDPTYRPELPTEVDDVITQQTVVTRVFGELTTAQALYNAFPTSANLAALNAKKAELQTEQDSLTAKSNIDIMRFEVSDGTNSKTLHITAGDLVDGTIYDLESKINKLGTNVRADYDQKTGRMFLFNNKSGKDNKINIEVAPMADGRVKGTNVLKNLNLMARTDTGSTISSDDTKIGYVKGEDAKIKVDGLEIESDSNIITVSGVTYTVQKKTTGPVSVQINNDIDKTIETVKEFVDSYNKIMDSFNKKNSEKYYKSYAPLTDEQKEAMSDDQIKNWEAKSKSGLLYHDSILKELITSMRSSVTNVVSGLATDYNSALSIGITTKGYQEGGKLYLDEDRLRAALDADPDCVTNIFSSDGATSSQQGIGNRIYNSLADTMTKLSDKAGTPGNSSSDTQSTLAKLIDKYDDRMTRMEKRLEKLQTQYYKKFDALETSYARLQSQNSWLFSS